MTLLVTGAARELCGAVGVAAWAVLADVALDAEVDAQGRLLTNTDVRRIAAHLAISKDSAPERWLASLAPASSSEVGPGAAPVGDSSPRATSCASALTPASPS